MTLPRLYSSETLQNATACMLGEDNLRYLKTVLRLKPGDAVIVFDGFGHEFEARIDDFGASGVRVALGARIEPADRNIRITLAQAVPKAGKMDVIVKTAAELGADEIIPFTAVRSVGRIEGDRAGAKVARWQKIVVEAARCCRSSRVARMAPLMTFDRMLSCAGTDALKMIFWEEEDQTTIRDALTAPASAQATDYFIIVGPEGGLSRDEIEQARRAGFMSVTLGRQILKVETAAAAILSIVQYEKGIFSQAARKDEK
ncbi:MAG: 16S rRNA (uracil(1498)-N(3))-methyltransferase [Smithellaceae bacterium]